MTTFRGLPGERSDLLEIAWGDLVDPLEFLRDDPSFGLASPLGMLARGDRDHGQARPVLNTETDLDQIRATGRLLEMISPAAICAIGNLQNYVIGSGYEYAVRPEKGNENKALVEACQKIVDEFLDVNDFVNDLDRELYRRAIRDGERFPVVYPVDGIGQIRVIEPELVREPGDKQALESFYGIDYPSDWTFGVHTRTRDIQKPLGYYVQWSNVGDDFDYLSTEDVLHDKRNVDRSVKRGISDLYPVKSFLERAEKLLGNTADGAAIQAAIAFIREHVQGATPAQVESFRDNKTFRQYQESTPYAERTRSQTRYKSGTVINVPAGQKYLYGPLGQSNAPVFLEIEQAVLRYVGMRWNMPEYMISSDASNANYSSTLVAESPFVKFATSEQKREAKAHQRLIWRALGIAVQAGRLQEFGIVVMEQLDPLIDIMVEPPMVATRDPKQEVDVRKILSDAGLLSDETWAAQQGLNLEDEQAKGAEKALPPAPFGADPNAPNPEDPNAPKLKKEPEEKKADVTESLAALVEDAFKALDDAGPAQA